jgi:CheY-like chemotaxis protein
MSTILVVDDVAADRQLLVTLLSAQGHTVLEADQASTAWAQLRQHRPALVIVDISLPGLTGLDLVAHLRAEPTLAATPVLFYTARYDDTATAQAIRATGAAVLAKPVSPTEVVGQVEAVLRAAMGEPGAAPPAAK